MTFRPKINEKSREILELSEIKERKNSGEKLMKYKRPSNMFSRDMPDIR